MENPSSRKDKDETDRPTPEELDLSNLATDKASRKFKRAERRGLSVYLRNTHFYHL